jgi:hypothetical protein
MDIFINPVDCLFDQIFPSLVASNDVMSQVLGWNYWIKSLLSLICLPFGFIAVYAGHELLLLNTEPVC